MKILIDKEKLEERIKDLKAEALGFTPAFESTICYKKIDELQSILQQGEEYKGSVDEEGFGITRVIYDKKEDSKVTRLEVIDHSPQGEGRTYIQCGIKELELSYQDDGKTLKIFIK